MADKAKAVEVDFSGVKDRGNFNPKQVPEGDYAAIITKVENGESKGDGGFQYIFTFKLKKFSQNSYPYYCKIQENQLWKLRNVLVAAGINVPKKKLKVDPNRVVGKEVGVTMADDEYEGKMKSVVDAVFPVAELAGEAIDDSAADDADEEYSVPSVDDDEPAEVAPKKKDKGGKKKKKGKENLEEMDISEV
jgi:hypothetical protein